MLELYFLFYRIPKMMSRLARERNRSAVVWSILGILTWIGAELLVAFTLGLVHGLGVALWGWPSQSTAVSLLTYALALIAALASVTLLSRILTAKATQTDYPAPPPPPSFAQSEQRSID